jgi:DNA-directed RNA polymerase specialized sigma subunit
MYMDYKKQEEVAGKLGVTQSYISRLVKKGETYKGYKIEKMYV